MLREREKGVLRAAHPRTSFQDEYPTGVWHTDKMPRYTQDLPMGDNQTWLLKTYPFYSQDLLFYTQK